MANQVVTVTVPGTGKELVLETDPATGRTSGRIDGRAVMKPLAENEEERDFKVGDHSFIVRRMEGGGFDVDIAPAEFITEADPYAPSTVQFDAPRKSSRSGTVIGAIVITILLVLLGRVVFQRVGNFVRASSTKIEVTRFTCQPLGREQFEAIIELTNLSSDPLELTAHVTLIGMGRSQIREFEGKVNPSPLPPDASGRVRIRDYKPDAFRIADGDCRLNAFTDASGKKLSYREPARK